MPFPFALINATRVYLDLRDTRAPRFLAADGSVTDEICPVCDSTVADHCHYDAIKDRVVCGACSNAFYVNEEA